MLTNIKIRPIKSAVAITVILIAAIFIISGCGGGGSGPGMPSGSGNATVTGRIIDGSTAVVYPANISVNGISLGSNQSDGRFSFTGVQTGTLTVSKLGYISTTKSVNPGDNNLGDIRIDISDGSDPGGNATVIGRITDGNPSTIYDHPANISVNGSSGTNNLDGTFNFTGVLTGPGTLTVSKKGYFDYSMPVDLKSGDNNLGEIMITFDYETVPGQPEFCSECHSDM
ncbi:MAG: carboxypeptidase-like regulatory domain-containing protein [Armatimonadota bacterium]|nr:carboxypeptidase-like regulatory domain-containing protein [Armatimonadota bacterium]